MKTSEIIVFIAASLDGFIATKDHRLDWLLEVEGEGDNGISKFYNTIDTIIMGKNTYQWIVDHANSWPYQDKTCVVFSNTKTEKEGSVSFVNGDLSSLILKLEGQGSRRIWLMGGSRLIASFINENLVDELILTFAPVFLGDGIPLLEGLIEPQRLRFLTQARYGQFVTLHYEVLQD